LRYGKSDWRKILALYSVLFAVCAGIVWLPFIVAGKTFVWNADGISQHIPALIYYRRWLQEVIQSFIDLKPYIPEWSFSLGEGADILNTLHFYCIGDPFSLGVLLFPESMVGVFYTISVIVRIYLAGVFFCLLMCEVFEDTSRQAKIFGALVYVFSCWTLFNAVRHAFFINPLVFLPLMLLGMERLAAKNKWGLYVVATALACVSSVYFFYMLVLLNVFYAVVRFPKIRTLLKIAAGGICGCLIGAIALLPQISVLLQDTRVAGGEELELFYDLNYYLKMPQTLLSGGPGNYLCLGFGTVAVLCMFLVFRKEGSPTLRALIVFCACFVAFPLAGKIFNGFSYASNRWSFATAAVAAAAVTACWDRLVNLEKSDAKFLKIAWLVYSAICIGTVYLGYVNYSALAGVALGFLVIPVCYGSGVAKKDKSLVLACVALLCIVGNGVYCNSFIGDDAEAQCLSNSNVNLALNGTEAAVMADLGDDGFYRYSGDALAENANLVFGGNTTQYYWSTSNPYVSSTRALLQSDEYRNYYYNGYSGRAELLALAGVKYYVTQGGAVPYGYEEVVSRDGYNIYSSELAMPLVTFYDNAISTDVWESLPVAQRQDALLYSVVADDGDGSVQTYASILAKTDDISLASDGSETVNLEFDIAEKGEVYICFEGLEFVSSESGNRAIIYVDGKPLSYFTSDFNWYIDRHDFAVDLGVLEEGHRTVSVVLSTPGTYEIKSLTAQTVPVASMEEGLLNLKEKSSVVSDLEMPEDRIRFNVESKSDGYLVLSVPYSEGWAARVDGEAVETFVANGMYTGIKVAAGSHSVELEYETPYLRLGAMVSVAALLLFVLVSVIIGIMKRKKPEEPGTGKIKIAVAAHKPYPMPEDPMYVPVFAGASKAVVAIPEGWERDDTGDNISEKNPYYCELTCLYWLLKNGAEDASYLGLVHYRRLFGKRRAGVLRGSYIEALTPEVKVFVPRARSYVIETLASHYAHTHGEAHPALTGNILAELCPEYLPAWKEILGSTSGYMFNMMVMEKGLLEEYFSWLLPILDALCEKSDLENSGLSAFDRRFPGRIAELLFNCWLAYKLENGELSHSQIRELPVYTPERVNWFRKGANFLKAKFFGKKYDRSV